MSAIAQDEIPTEITIQNRTGDLPVSTAIGTDIEHVEPATGNLIVRIPFVDIPGRKNKFSFGLNYDAAFLTSSQRASAWLWLPEQRNWLTTTALGWTPMQGYVTYNFSTAECAAPGDPYLGISVTKGYLFVDNDGTKHSFPYLGIYKSAGCHMGDFNASNLSDADYEGQGLWATINVSGNGVNIHFPDGSSAAGGGTSGGQSDTYDHSQFYDYATTGDANGNYQTVAPGGTDTLGRTLLTQSNGTNQITYQVYDSNHNLQSYVVNLESIAISTDFNTGVATDGSGQHISEYAATRQVVSSIVLPNLHGYSFLYDSYGGITQMTLPTGAVINYQWETVGPGAGSRRVVTQRIVHDRGNTYEWDISGQTPTGVDGPVTVTGPADSQGNRYKTVYSYDVNQNPIRIQKLDLSGKVIRQYDITYLLPNNKYVPLPTVITTTLDNGLVSQKQIDYEVFDYPSYSGACRSVPGVCEQNPPVQGIASATRGNATDIREYGYGQGAPGPLLRKIHNTFLHVDDPNYFIDANKLVHNIVDKVHSQIISDASGNPVAQIKYSYDTVTPPALSNVPNHSTPTTSYRGNVTAASRWRNTDGAWLTTNYGRDDTGNIISITDPLGHSSKWDYTDNWNGRNDLGCVPSSNGYAYPTTISDALNHQKKVAFYPCTGLKLYEKDPNDIAAGRSGTAYTYDELGREKTQTTSDGGSTTKNYNDSVPNTVTTTVAIANGVGLTTIAEMDDRGNQRKTTLTSDPDGPTYTRIEYDGEGRKYQEWNATRCDPDSASSCGSETTFGSTLHLFDTLGRETTLIPPDGTTTSNNVGTSYNGNVATVTDQAGVSRQSTTDALGHLIQINEEGEGTTTIPAVPATGSSATFTVNGSVKSAPDPNNPAKPGSGTVSLAGTERSVQVQTQTAAAGTGVVTIVGTEQSINNPDEPCPPLPQKCPQLYDRGNVSITVNGLTEGTVYTQYSTAMTLAQAIATAFNNASNSTVTATAASINSDGATVTFVAKTVGASTNYSVGGTSSTLESAYFSGPSFTANAPTNLSGGQDNAYQTVYDTGTVSIAVAGVTKSAAYGQGTTTTQIASALASALSGDSSTHVSAVGSGSAVVITATSSGAGTNYSLSTSSSTTNSAHFTGSSFTASSGSSLTGGQDQGTLYDQGVVHITVGSYQAQSPYSTNASSSSVAAGLASALSASGSPVTATASSNTVTLHSTGTGSATNYSLSSSAASNYPSSFSSSSFSVSAPGSMTGGTDGTPAQPGHPNGIYSLSTPWTTQYTYDLLDNLTCVEQHGGVSGTGCSSPASSDASSPWRVRRFSYDSLSELLSTSNPESGTIHYAYNNDGVLISKTDARGYATNYSPSASPIDALHRVTQKTYSNGDPAVSYSYDASSATINGIGHRTGMTDASGSTSWTYDSEGRETSETRTISGVTKAISTQYNLDSSVAQITYPSGSILKLTPGGAGRPLALTDTAHSINYAQNLTYVPTEQLHTALYGKASAFAGITESNSYNSRLQPVMLSASTASQTLLSLSYGFGLGTNDNGNLYQLVNNKDNTRNQTFTYDGVNRLWTARTPSTWGVQFAYDAWGNLYEGGQISGTVVNPQPLTTTVQLNNQLMGYGYDAAGNMLNDSSQRSCAGNAYSFNAEEQVSCAVGVNYTYDGDGNRAKKSSGTLYWGPGPLLESDASGNLTEEYIFLNGKRIARRDLPSGTVHYYLSDHLGSSDVVTDASGNIQNESDYYPFGGERAVTQNLSNQRYKFTGKERDTESGNDYFGARYYSSTMGRWISPDWSAKPEAVPYSNLGNPQSLNLYGYVRNNSSSSVDSDGHETMTYNDGALNRTDAQNAPMSHTEMKMWAGVGLGASMLSGAGELAMLGRGLLTAATTLALTNSAQIGGFIADAIAPPGSPSFSVWNMGPAPRGLAIEAQLGANLPGNFPTIDRFANGVATSIKSIDLNASSYQNAAALTSKITGYIDSVAGFLQDGAAKQVGSTVVRAEEITARELDLAIPPGASPSQLAALNYAAGYALKKRVKLRIMEIR